MRITSNNYPNIISNSFTDLNNKTTQTTLQERLKNLSSSKPVEENTEENNISIGFGDLIDAINPLQHIPVVSSIYRKITGDEISAVARVAGGGLFGGVLGAFVGAVESAFKVLTGKDVGEHAVAFANYNKEENIVSTVAAVENQIISNEVSNIEENKNLSSKEYLKNTENKYFSLNKEDSFISFQDTNKMYSIDREAENKTFDLEAKKQLDKLYIPQVMALSFSENTLEKSKISHIKKDSEESVDFWSRPISSNISADNAFIASSFE